MYMMLAQRGSCGESKEPQESTLGKDSLVPLIHHDPSDLGLICLVNCYETQNPVLDFRNQSWIIFNETHP